MRMVHKTSKSCCSGNYELDNTFEIMIRNCFFRVPKEGDRRNEWIKSISKFQQFDFYSAHFNLCELHFRSEDFVVQSGERKLTNQAVPTIFNAPVLHDSVKATPGCCNIKNCVHRVNNEDDIPTFR